MDDQRLIELEIKIAHQEIAIEDLHKAVYEHQATIEKLEKTLKSLTDRVEGVKANEIGPGNVKPPHY